MNYRREYWDRRSLDFSTPHGRLRVVARMLERAQRSASTLLDVGCAGAALRTLLPSTIEYFGVDIAETAAARQRDSAHFEVVDLEIASTCFSGRKFDIVVCSGVVEYVRRLDRFFAFIRDVMRPEGFLVLTFLNHEHYLDVFLHKSYKDPHVNFLSITAFVNYVRAQGFRIERETSLTVSNRELPLLAHCRRSPFNLWNRNYVFVCQRQSP